MKSSIRYWTPDDELKILEMLADGYSCAEIAKHLHRSYQTLKNQLRAMRKRRNSWNNLHMVAEYLKEKSSNAVHSGLS